MKNSADCHAIPINVIDQHVGTRLSARRLALRLTSDDVARRLGISHAELEAIEAGSQRINYDTLIVAGHLLNVPDAYFYSANNSTSTISPDRPGWEAAQAASSPGTL
jgi:RNA polymerase sigma-70 factor (ECF subfamily)